MCEWAADNIICCLGPQIFSKNVHSVNKNWVYELLKSCEAADVCVFQEECILASLSSPKLAFLRGTSKSPGQRLSMFCLTTVMSRSVWAFYKLDIY